MRIGAHVSTAGGLAKAIDRAQELGAECIQIFASSPQMWAAREPDAAMVRAFREKAVAAGIGPVAIHGIYLINLATDNAENLAKGTGSLKLAMRVASAIGALGVIFHVGSHRGAGFEAVLHQAARAMAEVIAETPEDVWLIMENNAGQGQNLGARFSELGSMMREVGSARLKVCLDTCHTLASGYEIRTRDGLEATLAEFEREIGLGRLVSVHANDSKVPLGANVDRHENIGYGHIGREGFETILSHRAFAEVPFFLEVPGMDGKSGPDKPNMDTLRELRDRVFAVR